jgi:nicotinamide mononucleotide transporter
MTDHSRQNEPEEPRKREANEAGSYQPAALVYGVYEGFARLFGWLDPKKEDPDSRPKGRSRGGVMFACFVFTAVTLGLCAGRASGWVTSSWLEIFGAVTGAACVLLVVARSVWNFPLGIVSCVAYLVFFAQGKLFADAGLQVVFILLGVHGWVEWVLGRKEQEVPVRRVPVGELTALTVTFPAVWLGLVRLLEFYGGAAPTFDAFVTALSLASQWLLNRRYIENWLGWIVVDQVAVALFWSRGMHLTAVLYALFLVMCVAGLVEWRRNLREVGR